MSIEIKNILTVPEIEEPTGEENLLVESNGAFKRLPSSNFSGGSGTGFDVTAWITMEVSAKEGYTMVDLGDITDDTEYGESGQPEDPTVESILTGTEFDSATTTNVYKANVTLTAYGMTTILYFYYDSDKSRWEFSVAEELDSDYFDTGYVANVQTDLTFAELYEAASSRCLSVLMGTSTYDKGGVKTIVAPATTIMIYGSAIAGEVANEFGVVPDGDIVYCAGQTHNGDTIVVIFCEVSEEFSALPHVDFD